MYIQKYYKVIRIIKDGDGGATPLYIENVSDSDGEFQLNKSGSPTYTPNLIYRIGDNGEWFEYDVTTLPSITVPSGSKIYFRGDNGNGFNQSISSCYRLKFSNSYNIGGYLTSLLSLDNFNTISNIPSYSFSNLFNQQKTLLNAKDVITDNIINVGNSSFYNCFNYCSSLVNAPQFNNLTTVSVSGFHYCFYSCRALTTAPSFNNLTTVNLHGFHYCFEDCTALTTAPRFDNLSEVLQQSFQSCFEGCTSLQVVYAPNVSTWNTNNFSDWLNNVSPTGIIYKPANLTIPTGTNGVPEGWNTVDY